MIDPLHQFLIKPIIPLEISGIDISFTNASLFMVLSTLIAYGFFYMGIRRAEIIPNKLQAASELVFEFIEGIMKENAGSKILAYSPLVFSIFLFVFMGNLLGLMPYGFTYTSHIVVTFALAMMVFIIVTVVGLLKHGWHFFSLFLPQNTPLYIAPIVVPIEIISYFTRPISLSMRLFANMVAGHMILKVFAGFTVALGVFGLAPLGFNVFFTGFELLVALLQAYVFTVLTCVYLNDALYLH